MFNNELKQFAEYENVYKLERANKNENKKKSEKYRVQNRNCHIWQVYYPKAIKNN